MLHFLKNPTKRYFYQNFAYSLIIPLVFLVFATPFLIFNSANAAPKKVGIIVPLEHEALKQIITGIEESLKGSDAEIIVKNAHGDLTLMSSIISQMKDQDLDVIAPIGTLACQMAIAHISDKPIVCAAAQIDSKNYPYVTGVNDEVPVTISLAKLPMLKRVGVIYSASEKVIPEVDELKAYAKKNGITLYLRMVQTLVDMNVVVASIPEDAQTFLVLKDHLIVSGINILTQIAHKRSIPIITCDEGSVKGGATIAIGVKEKEIGLEAGLMAKAILNGTPPNMIPYKAMDSLVLFVNEAAFKQQKILTKKDLQALRLPQIIISNTD